MRDLLGRPGLQSRKNNYAQFDQEDLLLYLKVQICDATAVLACKSFSPCFAEQVFDKIRLLVGKEVQSY